MKRIVGPSAPLAGESGRGDRARRRQQRVRLVGLALVLALTSGACVLLFPVPLARVSPASVPPAASPGPTAMGPAPSSSPSMTRRMDPGGGGLEWELRVDSWQGDLVSDGQRIYLATRENIQGFWGVIRVRWSDDGGRTWAAPVTVSRGDAPNAARHTLALAPDGSLWVAWVEAGARPAMQRIWVRRSTDRGRTWADPIGVTPAGGLSGLPVLLLTPSLHLLAWTDGESGVVLVQPLDATGMPEGWSPSIVGATQLELYSNSSMRDAGLALASRDDRVYAFWHSSWGSAQVSVSNDGGQSWKLFVPPTLTATNARLRLLVDGGQLYALFSQLGGVDGVPPASLDLYRAEDRGWSRVSQVNGGYEALEGELARMGSGWVALYSGCGMAFTCGLDWRIWLRRSPDLVHWHDPQPLSGAGRMEVIGVIHAGGATCAVWLDDSTGIPTQRHVFIRVLPDAAPTSQPGTALDLPMGSSST